MAQTVQCYFLSGSPDVPNNRLPVLHYRGVLPEPYTEETATQFLTSNKWEKRGTWGHIGIRHFHPNSHECYGIFRGHSTLLLGQISPTGENGVEINVKTGDVIVLPAGTAHSSLRSSSDYRYIGVYPEGCPRWRNETGKRPATNFTEDIKAVGMPEMDPVYGSEGPLVNLWQKPVLSKL
ncbi:hypothetical protein EDB80DRAFT_891995 [Ilyonectria destructans]|nr:hypothetical protein EDB80DRAFT_891995 [Ilyonectria destructans]